MTNQQKVILREIKAVLKATNTFNVIGDYENSVDFEKVQGHTKPNLLIQDGNEVRNEDWDQAGSVEKSYYIHIWYYDDITQKAVQLLLDRQNTIEDAVIDNSLITTLGTNADCILWQGVEKGDYLDVFDYRAVGFKDNFTCRKITFEVRFRTAR